MKVTLPWDTHPNFPAEACGSKWVVLLGMMLEHKQYEDFHLSLFVLEKKNQPLLHLNIVIKFQFNLLIIIVFQLQIW